MEDYTENIRRCNEYIEALEEERRKIQVFQRELPLCLELVNQTIEGCRQQLPCAGTMDYLNGHQQSDCSEQVSNDGPVLEEFIPIKKSSSDDDDDEEEEEEESKKPDVNSEKSGKKLDWLRSVQLWNQTPDSQPNEDLPKKEPVVEVKKNVGAFKPFNKQKNVSVTPPSTDKSIPVVPPATASSSAGTESGGSGSSGKEDKQGDSSRKQRRCWSPELHRRFLNALQQLGGAHVATPKQIREFMKVDGLTNDEVKSHLQKYRLHTRRPSSGVQNTTNNTQGPQFVVVGGIWVQPSEYQKTTENVVVTKPKNGVYAPIASLPKRSNSNSREGHSRNSTSPASSTSVHTTTTSLVF